MPDLSACYFCGTALDEPLSEYPVVPMTLKPAPEDQKTVVLCSVCRRKLGKVLDAVMDSIDGRPIEATVQQDLDEASDDVVDDASANDDSANAVGEDVGDVEGEPEDEWTGGDEMRDTAAADGEAETVAEDDEVPARADGTQEADDGDAGEESPVASDGTGEDEDGPQLTALEYTKVMRLLENRDLPVDREEFRIVATNAYEITPQEFDLVVDAAIDRGLLVEEDGQFVDVE